MHANVGGGYPDDSMAHVPLDWIVSEAERLGLKFKPTAHEELHMGGDPTGRLYNSRRGLAGYYRYGPRRLDVLNNDKFTNVIVDVPKIHESVFKRIKIGVGAPHSGVGAYTPFVLPETYAVVRYDGTIEYGPSKSFQTTQQDQSRARRQERAWDWVWWRRVVYFLTVFTSVYLVVTPASGILANFFYQCPWIGPWLAASLGSLVDALSSAWQSISTFIIDQLPAPVRQLMSWIAHWVEGVTTVVVPPVLDLASGFLPSVSKRWIDYYKMHPAWFALWAAVIGFWIWVGSYVENRINAIMQKIWHHGAVVDDAPKPANFLYKMRTSDVYRWFIIGLKQYIIPTFFALLFLYIGITVLYVFWRTIYPS